MVPHRSLTVPFELFRFWLQIRGDIHNQKMTPRVGESATLRLGESATLRLDESGSRRVGESAFECLKEKLGDSESRRLPEPALSRANLAKNKPGL